MYCYLITCVHLSSWKYGSLAKHGVFKSKFTARNVHWKRLDVLEEQIQAVFMLEGLWEIARGEF